MFVLICALSWIDYQVFTEGTAQRFSPIVRQLGHITILTVVLPVGYIGCSQYYLKTIKYWWAILYIAGICLLVATGLLQWKLQLFSTSFLDRISALRLFLCSPVPYFMLYIINSILDNRQPAKQNL